MRTYSVRLDDEDVAVWDGLMARWRLDRSDTLRRLLREYSNGKGVVQRQPVVSPKASLRPKEEKKGSVQGQVLAFEEEERE